MEIAPRRDSRDYESGTVYRGSLARKPTCKPFSPTSYSTQLLALSATGWGGDFLLISSTVLTTSIN